MIRILISCALVVLPLISLGQHTFKLNSRRQNITALTINGNKLEIDSNFTKIESNYPAFDTITLLDYPVPVLCNFKPDSSYSLWYACCGSIDILPTWQVDSIVNSNLQFDDENYPQLAMDRPTFTLRVINNTKNDSIYGWYVDHACFPQFKLLNTPWDYGSAIKCYYWNNISEFVFFKSNMDYSSHSNESGVIEDWFPFPNDDEKVIIDKIGRIHVRLFDDEHYFITYDAQLSKVYLEN